MNRCPRKVLKLDYWDALQELRQDLLAIVGLAVGKSSYIIVVSDFYQVKVIAGHCLKQRISYVRAYTFCLF